ncbi:MAG: ChaN family lipoprotein [Nitrospirota bacterium]|nr:ChaN family lipoprotein [Nitrospirota bacterium]
MNYRILDAKKNKRADFNVLLETVKKKDIIYVGEFHQIPEVISFQMDLVSGLVCKDIHPAIGLEIFNVLQQKLLDYYISRVIPFELFLSLYDMSPEGFDINHYINLIEIAVKKRLKVIALTIPRNIASDVARYGLDREVLKNFHLKSREIKNLSNGYKKTIGSFYKKHPHKEITEENFILAQSIKDEMMAETIAFYLTEEPIGIPLIVVVGRGHIEYGFGIPERVRRKLRKKKKSISDVLIATAYDDEHFKKEIADYILLI